MTTREEWYVSDPYNRCEDSCHHDLAKGVLTAELLGGDGPYPDNYQKPGMGPLASLLIAQRVREARSDNASDT